MKRTESRTADVKRTAELLITALLLAVARAQAADAAAAPSTQQDAKSQREVVVSLQDRKLALVEDGRVLKIYTVAVGAKNTPSPTGEFQIVTRLQNPTWYYPGKVVPAGKDNPLGNRWIGLSKKGYGIHGTNAPKSIGKAASHGCIRVGKRDLEELFQIVRAGDTVQISDEPLANLTAPYEPQEINTEVAQAQTDSAAGVR
jgi:lipoprotein-anchoring transpeptidase ErfK/SrfK